MKYIFFAICLLIIVEDYTSQNKLIDQSTFTYFTRRSFNFEYYKKTTDNWLEFENDTVILTKYFKGSPCDLPLSESMSMNIEQDTLIFDCGRVYDPNCEREIGVGAVLIDFVVNKSKYPNYKKLIVKYKYDGPNR